jgi:hypothetical protein
MAVNVDRMKNPRAAKQQQQGAIRFHLQRELDTSQIIKRLKMSLSGESGDSSYNHRVTGNLEKSITPNKDGQKIWGKNITSKIKVDNYLGLGIGIEQVSVRIDMALYGDELDQGFIKDVEVEVLTEWVMRKARRYPTSGWYLFNGKKPYYYYGDEVTKSIATVIAKSIKPRLNSVGYKGSRWLSVLKGKQGLNGALQRAFNKYLGDYPDYVYGTVSHKLDKMLSKL